ncbi:MULTISPECIES: flagellar protein FliT [unclassified Zymobacter]|uniref:flagellar protein FliT n=1 Tax=unclassified Zymobacter TaxID=3048685 RepID=UPI0039C1C65C
MIDSMQDGPVDSGMQVDGLMDEYRKIIEHSERMVRKAQEGEWDALVNEGMEYLVQAEQLSSVGDTQLSFSQRRERQVYLQRLLDNDRKIREQLDVRLKELGTLMAEEEQRIRTHKVSNAYQRFSGS